MTSTTPAACGRIVRSAFVAHPLLRNAHLQTIAAAKLRPTPRLALRIERRELPDGDFIDLGWSGPDDGPLVVLLHGLTGCLHSKYALGTARALHRHGLGTVQMQFRGAGEQPNRHDRSYHSGDTGDLAWLLETLRASRPGRRLYAVGWSLGGNVLLKYLGEQGDRAPLSGAVAVSVPYLLAVGAERMRRGFSRVYQRSLLANLKRGLRRKFANRPAPFDLAAALASRDFYEFDERCTAPLNGFASAEDYWERCSSRPFLRRIAVRTHLIHALDDPFLSPEVVPRAEELSPAVTLELSERGGHVGFLAAGSGWWPRCWLETHIAETIRAWDTAQD